MIHRNDYLALTFLVCFIVSKTNSVQLEHFVLKPAQNSGKCLVNWGGHKIKSRSCRLKNLWHQWYKNPVNLTESHIVSKYDDRCIEVNITMQTILLKLNVCNKLNFNQQIDKVLKLNFKRTAEDKTLDIGKYFKDLFSKQL